MYITKFPALLAGSLVGVCGLMASAQTKPAIVISQLTLLAGFPSGGALSGGNPAGNSFAVNSLGNLVTSTTYGGEIVQFDGKTGAATSLGKYSSPGPVAVDGSDNLYIGDLYDTNITKIPMVGGTYVALSTPGSSTPVCTGNDTVECILPTLATGLYGYATMAFDTAGTLYFSSTNGGPSANALFKCSAACLTASSPSATLIYQEPVNAAAQLLVGGIAIDSYGNVFFTDSVISGNSRSASSNLNELLFTGTGTTKYSPSVTVLYTLTNAVPTDYDNQLDGVAVDSLGTVYFATQFDGIYAFLNTRGMVDTANLYTVATQGAKMLTADKNGSLFLAAYSNATGGDAAQRVSVGAASLPETAVGVPSTATNVTTILNNVASCGSAPTVSFTSSAADFTAATTGSCSTANISNASTFPTTITFNPSAGGTRTATLTATDSTGGSGTAAVTGIGDGPPAATPAFSPAGGAYSAVQTITISDSTTGSTIYYTTDGTTPTPKSTQYTGPISVSSTGTIKAIAVATGYQSSAVGSATYTITLPTATPTFSPSGGTYNATQSVTLADTATGAVIYYTTDGTTPTTSSKVYTAPIAAPSTITIKAIALAPGSSVSAIASSTYTINLPTFTLAINPSALTIASGGQALTNVTVTPLNGFAAAVTFACSGLPSGASCSFAPTTVTPNATNPVTTVMTINAPTSTAGIHTDHPNPFFPAATLALTLCFFGAGRRRAPKLLLMVTLSIFGANLLTGCEAAQSASNHTPTTSTVTVTATSGTIHPSATMTLTVQ